MRVIILPDKAIGHFRHECVCSKVCLARQLRKIGQLEALKLTDDVSLTGPDCLLKFRRQIQSIVNFIQYAQQGLAPLYSMGRLGSRE